MTIVTVRAAKANLSKLLQRVEAGEEIVIARGETPVARLTPVYAPPASRRFAALKGIIRLARSSLSRSRTRTSRNGSRGRCVCS
jgi:prevent-host-death family protein